MNSADQMIFQTEKQLKEFGEKLSEEKKAPIESALEELKKAYEAKNLGDIDKSLKIINEAWKNASEEMYKAQAESTGGNGKESTESKTKTTDSGGDDVQDVDFEEVK